MPTTRTVLTDTDSGVWLDSFRSDATGGRSLAGAMGWSIRKTTLRGGLSEGVDVVTLNNGQLSMSVLPTRGMGLWKGTFRGVPIGWASPVQRPVNPAFVNLKERGGLGWLSGFNELMCRCGLSFNGPPGTDRVVDDNGNVSESELTLHGRIANLPAHHVAVEVNDDDDGTITVTGIVDECSMFGPALRLTSSASTIAGSNSLQIRDIITNMGGQPAEVQLLYHTNLGSPFLEAGSKVVAAFSSLAPRDATAAAASAPFDTFAAPQAGFREEVFFFELLADSDDQTSVLLKNAAGDLGMSLSFSRAQLPCFTLWKNTQAEADGCVAGLEPGTNLPNLKTFERESGRLIMLAPGASCEAVLTLTVYDNAADVKAAESAIRALQTAEGTRHNAPVRPFSPV